MKRIVIEFIFCAACFALGFFIHAMQKTPERVVIKQGEIHYNTVDVDPAQMPEAERTDELRHFYGDAPTLELIHVGGDKYKMNAGLYRRKWDRDVSISIPSRRNMIIGNALFDTHLRAGFMVQYFRMFDNVGIGAGIGGTLADQFLSAGAVYQW